MLYHLDAWLTRPPVPFVTAVPGFRYRSIPSERCAPLHGGVRRHEKSLLDFPWIAEATLLHVAKPPSMALYRLARKSKKSLRQSPIHICLFYIQFLPNGRLFHLRHSAGVHITLF